jgi:serine/threonine protein kinase
MALTSGTKLSQYEILSPLGAGGMGEVYRAADTKLGRDVALKVLPAEMAHDPERLARFRHEAKALAQLDHPNIVTIHSVEESDGVHFLTMQLVEGQPLDRLIPQGGLPLERIVDIATAISEALTAAHEKGIVHRDLKPANVMVTNEGRVKVLDFGLAKDVRGTALGDATLSSTSHTQVGVVMGTPAYMSPEQTSSRPLDHRTDIFSLGVLLHEMATGRRPFEGTSSAELFSAILRDTPPPVTDVRPDLPSDLARIIHRCLEKDPRHRMQTARDVSNEFRDLARQASQKSPPASRAVSTADSGATRADEGFWVAVLPFKYSGGNAELTALSEGLTEDIITGLSRFSYLRVIARGSTLRYASQAADLRTVGKELGARYVMEGTLHHAGTRLRLAVQLVDATTGAHLWAENYERTFSPETVFALQDDLVPRIVSTVADMNGVLPRSMSEALRSKADDQLSPHEAVLRAFSYFDRVTPEEHGQVRQILERAVRNAPDQSDTWAMLSNMYRDEHCHGFNLRPDPLGRALAAARHGVDAAPSNHLAQQALAATLFFQKDILAFRPAAERAIELNRMDGSTAAVLGILIDY